MLHRCRLKIPNNFIFELVLCKRNTMDHGTWGEERCVYVGLHHSLPPTGINCWQRSLHRVPVFPECTGVQQDSVLHHHWGSGASTAPLTPQKGGHLFHSNQLGLKEVNSVVSNENTQEILSYPFLLVLHPCISQPHWKRWWTERAVLLPFPSSLGRRKRVSVERVTSSQTFPWTRKRWSEFLIVSYF